MLEIKSIAWYMAGYTDIKAKATAKENTKHNLFLIQPHVIKESMPMMVSWHFRFYFYFVFFFFLFVCL